MQWNSISDFFAMGGYAFYVWGSFGVTALALVGEMWLIRQRRIHTMQTLRNELLGEVAAR
jgi:heme exporter protein D